MKKIQLNIFLVGVAFFLSTLSSCQFNCVRGSGHKASETRKVGDFNKINISGDCKINLVQDSSLTLNVTADDNLLKYIKTTVRDNTLRIKTKKNICTSVPISINIGIHKLQELTASGAVEITCTGVITTGDMELGSSGNSKITLAINAANLTTEDSGNMELNLTGQASSHHINISGEGKVEAFGFIVGDYDIETSGDITCEINVLNSLNINSSGSSSVKYKGNPSNISNSKSGSSSLQKAD
jgi:hypothetical protein